MGEIDEDNMIKSKDVIGLFFCPEGGGEEGGREGPRTRTRGRARGRCGRSQEEEEEEGRQVKAFIHINAPVITRIPQNHLSPRGGRFSVLVSTKKIHFQKNYRIVPERWINIFLY